MEDSELGQILEGIISVSTSEMKLKELELFLVARKIENLYHFTSIQNLNSLRENGFLGREALTGSEIQFQISDSSRTEPIKNAICFSFSKPNRFMMMNKINSGRDIVLLELGNPLEILSSKRFIASPGNFAKHSLKNDFMNWPEKFAGGVGLTRLFLNETLRKKYELEPQETTDPQAEIILLDPLPWNHVVRIFSPTSKEYASQEKIREFTKSNSGKIEFVSQNLEMFKPIDWSNVKSSLEFRERTWSPEWA
jgi:hypothetical protein